jgi:pleiotropic regulator 1
MMAQAASQTVTAAGQELPIEGKTVKALTLLSVKRTLDLFAGNYGQKIPLDDDR